MRRRFLVVLCLLGAVVLVGGACTPPGGPGNTAPTAKISAIPTTGESPLDVIFSASGSTDTGGSIASYMWDLGDDTTSGDMDLTHTYTEVKDYTVVLTVTDNKGKTDTDTVTISVLADSDVDDDGSSVPADCDDGNASIHPGAADPLDAAGIDSDCDGVDGILADTVFVDATDGTDDGSCGPDGSPCATIGQGVANANGTGKGVVQVSSGSYGGFTLSGDLIVRGGYTGTFDGRAGTTTVSGDGTGVLAEGATPGSTLMDLAINSGTPSGAGASAYGVRATGSTLAIVDSTIDAAAGNAGVAGSTPSGVLTSGSNGDSGKNGGYHSEAEGTPGGGAGANAGGDGGGGGANGATGVSGGSGGGGGCGNCVSNKSYSGAGGGGGAKGPNGSTGAAGAAGSAVFGATFAPTNGANAGNGGNGGGGGGGGGGGRACDDFWCSVYWVGGGAGGKGGGGGQGGAGGTGGTSGGGSFAVYAHDSTVVIDANTTLSTHDGGNGGSGGNGQAGASGGSGGNGGTGAGSDTVTAVPGTAGSGGAPGANGAPGGNGSNGTCCNAGSGGGGGGGGGGNGGSGGNGGGGAGGPSVAMLNKGSGSITFGGDPGTQVTIGGGGAGGTGGNNGATGQAAKTLNVA